MFEQHGLTLAIDLTVRQLHSYIQVPHKLSDHLQEKSHGTNILVFSPYLEKAS